uniref:Putative phospholipase n=1 Tax=Ixodes ricinus TaxID=34613 RepID=A0A0K8RF64_IXORI
MRDQLRPVIRTNGDQQITGNRPNGPSGASRGLSGSTQSSAKMRDRFASQRTKEDPTCRHRGRTVAQAYLVE